MKLIDEAVKLLKNHYGKVLVVPIALSSCTWIGNLMLSISDGVISDEEFHHLIGTASFWEVVLLVGVMAALKLRK